MEKKSIVPLNPQSAIETLTHSPAVCSRHWGVINSWEQECGTVLYTFCKWSSEQCPGFRTSEVNNGLESTSTCRLL